MQTRKSKLPMLALAASTLALLPSTRAFADQPITVNVNGSPVNFTGAPPVQVNGSVLVPLRGVFEAMGAGVNYDSAAHTITARKGSQVVILPLGATTASVNGQTQVLSQPAQVQNGTTLVPLRFVAEALGGYVDWRSAQNQVAITTPDGHLSNLPSPPGAGIVTGQLTGVFTNTNPQQITVRVNGDNTTIPITGDTVVLRSEPGSSGQQVALSDIQVGDQVTVRRDSDGYASSIKSTYGVLRGTVKSIGTLADGSHVVTLNDGSTVQLAPDARLRMNGRRIQMSDVMADERVLIRTNPSDHLGYELQLNPQDSTADSGGNNGTGNPTAAGPVVTKVYVRTTKITHAGDFFMAALAGTPGGSVVFSIPGVADSIPTIETEPGMYRVHFKMPAGIAVTKAAVFAQLTVLGNSSPLVRAPESVTIDTLAARVGSLFPENGSTVENDQPLIYAALADTGGIGVDANRSRLFVDGNDVTSSANVTGSYINYQPATPMAAGKHTAKVVVVDMLGNQSVSEWPFNISSRRLISRFATNVQPGAILNAGQPVNLTMEGPANGTASASILGVAGNIPLTEGQPGVYKGTYVVRSGDNTAGSPIVGRIKTTDGREITTVLSRGLSVAAGTPGSPVILTPEDGATVDGNITVSGTTAPLATVRVTLAYRTKAAGNFVDLSGTAATREATADAAGNWTVEDLPLTGNTLLSNSRNTLYTITAVTVDPNGVRSAESSITVEGGKVYAHHTGQE